MRIYSHKMSSSTHIDWIYAIKFLFLLFLVFWVTYYILYLLLYFFFLFSFLIGYISNANKYNKWIKTDVQFTLHEIRSIIIVAMIYREQTVIYCFRKRSTGFEQNYDVGLIKTAVVAFRARLDSTVTQDQRCVKDTREM